MMPSYSLIARKRPPMRTKLLRVLAMLLAAALPVFAKSARTIHPELVGVKTVALNFSPENLPGLDADALEVDIRKALEKAGITVQQAAPVTLYVRVTYQQLPACPEFVAFRTYLALSEDVAVHRGKRTETVYVDTWHESEDFVEPTSRAGKAAHQSVVGLLSSFIDAAQYTAEVMEKQACQTQVVWEWGQAFVFGERKARLLNDLDALVWSPRRIKSYFV
jgi:hypothetical protein